MQKALAVHMRAAGRHIASPEQLQLFGHVLLLQVGFQAAMLGVLHNHEHGFSHRDETDKLDNVLRLELI